MQFRDYNLFSFSLFLFLPPVTVSVKMMFFIYTNTSCLLWKKWENTELRKQKGYPKLHTALSSFGVRWHTSFYELFLGVLSTWDQCKICLKPWRETNCSWDWGQQESEEATTLLCDVHLVPRKMAPDAGLPSCGTTWLCEDRGGPLSWQ